MITEVQNEIIEEFSTCKESIDKYKKLIQLAKEHEPLDNKYKKSENAIKGCQSTVWLVTDIHEGKMSVKGDTAVMITKGILSLLLRVFDNQELSDIADSDLYFLEKIGLKQSLSPQRANGVSSIVEHIRNTAKKSTI